MKNVVMLLVLGGLLFAGWKYRHVLRGSGDKSNAAEDEFATSIAAAIAATPPPSVIPATPAPTVAATTPTPSAEEPKATPRTTSTALPVTSPAELVKMYRDSLVFVTGGDGAGSGFVADMGGKIFFLTNAHVAAGVRNATFNTLQGTAVKTGPASVAVGHDIFAMQTSSTGTPMEVMRDVDTNARIGDDVVVLGNAEGGGVINPLMGHIAGIGPNLIELTAPFQPGNSGSPIIHLKSRKVIGVATYLTIRKYDPATKQAVSEPVIRRFGYRIDSVKTWQPVNWAAFQSQAIEMEAVEKLTEDLVVFVQDIARGRVTPGRHTNPAIRNRIDSWMGSKSKQMSLKDRAAADQNFISFLKVTTQGDINNVRAHLTYDYFQRQLADQQRERTEIAQVFDKIIVNVQALR